ncbi:MAG: hypothetical protein KQH83_03595 [Actinobacteria bacterium]|jgi:carbon monoxide dehydrogenase subunit G|nr:hypothetical protein [Actinomycetota bacterium]
MRLRADFGVGHPAAEVWARLASPDGAGCVPGVEIAGPDGGSLAIDVEARHLVFDGSAAVASDRRARTVTVEARGVERAGRGRGRATLLLSVEEDGLFSTVRVEADLHLSGEVADMSRLIAEAAYRLADGVAECLDASLGSAPAPEAPAGQGLADGDGERHRPGWVRRVLGRLGLAGDGGPGDGGPGDGA